MSAVTPEAAAALAIRLAHEVYEGGCIDCGGHGVEMHELYGRQMRKTLGAAVCILGVTLAPLCATCHRKWEKISLERQLEMLQELISPSEDNHPVIVCRGYDLRLAQRDQLIALKARIGSAR